VTDSQGDSVSASTQVDVLLPGLQAPNRVQVPPGSTVTASSGGVTAALTTSPSDVNPATLLVAVIPTTVIDSQPVLFGVQPETNHVGYDVRFYNGSSSDVAVVTLQYPAGGVGLPVVTWYDPATGTNRLTQGSTLAPNSYFVDPTTHTIRIVLDQSSIPAIQLVVGTLFTVSVNMPAPSPTPPAPAPAPLAPIIPAFLFVSSATTESTISAGAAALPASSASSSSTSTAAVQSAVAVVAQTQAGAMGRSAGGSGSSQSSNSSRGTSSSRGRSAAPRSSSTQAQGQSSSSPRSRSSNAQASQQQTGMRQATNERSQSRGRDEERDGGEERESHDRFFSTLEDRDAFGVKDLFGALLPQESQQEEESPELFEVAEEANDATTLTVWFAITIVACETAFEQSTRSDS
jgi:hypothetical protein